MGYGVWGVGKRHPVDGIRRPARRNPQRVTSNQNRAKGVNL
jgi:hypothetical protein